MAVYFVSSAGSNTAPYDTWEKAATSLATALAAATADGDIVVIDKNAIPSVDASVAADVTYNFAGNISLFSATNDGGTSWTPSPMGYNTGLYIGHGTLNRTVTIGGAFRVYIYGITIRISGSTVDHIVLGNNTGSDFLFESCVFHIANTSIACTLVAGISTTTAEGYVELKSCDIYFSNTAHRISVANPNTKFVNCRTQGSLSYIFGAGASASKIVCQGCDFSNATSGIAENMTNGHKKIELYQCKIPSTLAAAQTSWNNESQLEIFAYDCSSADIHYMFMYFNGVGTLTCAQGGSEPYITSDGAQLDSSGTKYTWKIVTTANVSKARPFFSPWISAYNEGTSAITPYLEALMKGYAGTVEKPQLYCEVLYKETASSTKSTLDVTDRGTSTVDTTLQHSSSLGAGDWTNEDPTNNLYVKLAPESAITPAEAGDISMRVVFGIPSSTVYIDPKIRGL